MERRMIELFLQNKSNRDVCVLLKVGDRKVRRARALAISYGSLNGERKLPSFPEIVFPLGEPVETLSTSTADELLQTRRPWIEEQLAIGWRPITVWKELDVQVKRSASTVF